MENINQIASRIIISPFLSDLICWPGQSRAREGNYNVNLSPEIINSHIKLTADGRTAWLGDCESVALSLSCHELW